ncbi:MAG: EAL domain-containing protein [Sphingomonas bacterium]|nr:EAL domain-containing protein [Sphingomonas bacterium]
MPAVPVIPDRALEQALADDMIQLAFQPQIDPCSGQVDGAEALARWSGADSPEQIFARATAVGLTERLSRHVQRKALQAAGRWCGPLKRLRLSLNLVAEDLAREGYDDWLISELAAAAFDPKRLTLEITESSLVVDRELVSTRLSRLRALGIEIAVDDFGTGYANLAYLTSLPLDTLKIDRGLIAEIVGGSRDRIVVKAMIGMARELGLKVVVEGIETAAQLALVADWGCDLYQGFLVAGALDEAELSRFVAASHAAEAA